MIWFLIDVGCDDDGCGFCVVVVRVIYMNMGLGIVGGVVYVNGFI